MRLLMARWRLREVIRVGLVLALVVAGGPTKRRQNTAANTAGERGQSGAPPAGVRCNSLLLLLQPRNVRLSKSYPLWVPDLCGGYRLTRADHGQGVNRFENLCQT